jgi:hypothetical protein
LRRLGAAFDFSNLRASRHGKNRRVVRELKSRICAEPGVHSGVSEFSGVQGSRGQWRRSGAGLLELHVDVSILLVAVHFQSLRGVAAHGKASLYLWDTRRGRESFATGELATKWSALVPKDSRPRYAE